MVGEERSFRIGQRVSIISSGSPATIKATFALVQGYYDVRLDGAKNRRIAFETELEVLDAAEEGADQPGYSSSA